MDNVDLTDLESLTVRLVAARKSAGLTQRQLADAMGIAQTEVSRIETGGWPKRERLALYARAIGVRLEIALKPIE